MTSWSHLHDRYRFSLPSPPYRVSIKKRYHTERRSDTKEEDRLLSVPIHGIINRFRKLLVRYEKKSQNYLALVQLACCIIVYRRLILGWALNYCMPAVSKCSKPPSQHKEGNQYA